MDLGFRGDRNVDLKSSSLINHTILWTASEKVSFGKTFPNIQLNTTEFRRRPNAALGQVLQKTELKLKASQMIRWNSRKQFPTNSVMVISFPQGNHSSPE